MNQGEIWLINLEPTSEAEIKKNETGSHRQRQCFGNTAFEQTPKSRGQSAVIPRSNPDFDMRLLPLSKSNLRHHSISRLIHIPQKTCVT
jgi:hypothetical protein